MSVCVCMYVCVCVCVCAGSKCLCVCVWKSGIVTCGMWHIQAGDCQHCAHRVEASEVESCI